MIKNEDLPRDPNMDGSGLTITPLEHGMYCEPRCLEVQDEDGRAAIYVPMTDEAEELH